MAGPEHNFKVGQTVEYHPPRGLFAPRGPYIVTVALPARSGEFEYRIKHPNEPHERIAMESYLIGVASVGDRPDRQAQ
jgi:hypothetical protein